MGTGLPTFFADEAAHFFGHLHDAFNLIASAVVVDPEVSKLLFDLLENERRGATVTMSLLMVEDCHAKGTDDMEPAVRMFTPVCHTGLGGISTILSEHSGILLNKLFFEFFFHEFIAAMILRTGRVWRLVSVQSGA